MTYFIPMKKTITFILAAAAIITAQSSYHGLVSWYSPESVSMAGGISPLSDEIDRINPAYLADVSQARASLSMVKYPAGIQGKMINVIFPKSKKVWSVSLRHLNYGKFTGMDEDGYLTGEYQSGDTWLNVSAAKSIAKIRSKIGWSAGIFMSQLEQYQSVVLTFTPGIVFQMQSIDANLGLSLRNFGYPVTTYTDRKESLPTELTGTITKKLAHLPLELNAGINFGINDNNMSGTIGGVFDLPHNTKFRWGVSSDKQSQITQIDLSQDYIAGTGLGVGFASRTVEISVGGYAYGTGGWVSGAGIKLYL